MPADLPYLLGQIRDLTNRYKAGTPESFEAFRQLAFLLLSLTVLTRDGGLTLSRGPQGPDTLALGGWRGPDDPLPLNDGGYCAVRNLNDSPAQSAQSAGRVREGRRPAPLGRARGEGPVLAIISASAGAFPAN